MLKILQARLQQYVNREIPDVSEQTDQDKPWIVQEPLARWGEMRAAQGHQKLMH